MEVRPKVSIVIPIYNGEKYLDNCINSILNQRFNDFEVIFINDGSIDKTEEICKSYVIKNKNIRLINKENGGVSSARNLGISEANGEFICFIDADDKILPNYLTTFYDIAKKNEADVIVAGFKVSNNKESIKTKFKKNVIFSGQEFILTNENIHTRNDLCFSWRYFYKLSLINKNNIKFSEDISIGEDTIFNMEIILKSKRVIALDDIVYEYNVDNLDSAMSSKYKPNLERSLILQYDKKAKLAEEFHLNINEYYIKDMAKYYIDNILVLLINNIKNSNSKNKKEDIKRVLNYEMIRSSFKRIGIKYKAYSVKEYISYILMKFKIYTAVNYILKIK